MAEQEGNPEQAEFEAKLEELFTRGVDEVIGGDEIKERMRNGEKLRIKFGTDPTSPNIHIGRAVPLMKLRDFQNMGHQVVLIIGDFTGEVGDTSDKPSGRSMLDREKVMENMKTYAEQCGRILDLSKVEIHYNSEWLSKLTFSEVCQLADMFSVHDFISRSIIKDRLDAGIRVSVRELLYPLMQGYDSYKVKNDIELGGTDQRYNLLAGMEIQKKFGQQQQAVMMMNLINGLDGRKMSSSWGNVVKIEDNNIDMFGKLMSMKDQEIVDYFVHCTRVSMDRIKYLESQLKEGKINPIDVKTELAFEITRQYHGGKGALQALENFNKTVREKSLPDEMPEIEPTERDVISVLIMSGLASSKGDAKRLIQGRGVMVNGEVVQIFDFQIPENSILQKGKRGFVRVK